MLRRNCLIFVFIWFLVGGIGHFIRTDFFAAIVPPWVPMPHEVVLISGVFELLGAAGLLYAPTRRAAAWGLFVLTLCVTPANIYMWQNAHLFPKVPEALLLLRLPIQLLLLWCIVQSSRFNSTSNQSSARQSDP